MHHADERVEHVLEAFGHGLAVTELALAYQLQILMNSLLPTIQPARNDKAFHFQLVEYHRWLQNRVLGQGRGVFVVARDATAHSYPAVQPHLVHDRARDVPADL